MSALSLTERIAFYEELRHLVSAGIVLSQAMKMLRDRHGNEAASMAFGGLEATCASGRTLSERMADLPREFGDLEVNLVRAGEAGGRLEETLKSLADYFRRRQEIQRRIWGALLYPVGLIHVAIVFPSLPLLVLSGLFQYLRAVGLALLVVYGAAGAVWIVTRVASAVPGLAQAWDTVRFMVPWYGSATKRFAISRFATCLGHLIDAGLPAPRALELSAATLGIPSWKAKVEGAVPRVLAGDRLIEALEQAAILPVSASSILLAGEEGGQFPEACASVSKMMEDEGAHIAKIGCKVASLLFLLIAIGFGVFQIFSLIWSRLNAATNALG